MPSARFRPRAQVVTDGALVAADQDVHPARRHGRGWSDGACDGGGDAPKVRAHAPCSDAWCRVVVVITNLFRGVCAPCATPTERVIFCCERVTGQAVVCWQRQMPLELHSAHRTAEEAISLCAAPYLGPAAYLLAVYYTSFTYHTAKNDPSRRHYVSFVRPGGLLTAAAARTKLHFMPLVRPVPRT